METVHLDTHIVAWLWDGRADRARRIGRRLKGREAQISPAVTLELQVLHEIGRFRDGAEEVVTGLARAIGLTFSATPFGDVVAQSVQLTWCRDPFDRMIVGQAMASGCRLLTCDQNILGNCQSAFDL